MDDKTKTMMLTLAAGVIKKGLLTLSAGAVTHGLINSNQTEYFVAGGMLMVSAGWSFWNDYGKAIVLSQLEVLKAKSLAQAKAMTQNGVQPVTTAQIAAQSPTMGQAEVAKVVATLPEVIQANVKGLVLVAILVLGAMLATAGDASAQIKVRLPDPLNLTQKATPAPSAQPAATGGLSKLMSDLAGLQKKIVDDAIADITAADADASMLVNPSDPASFRDPISHACYPAAIRFLSELPVATAPTGTLIAVQLFQKKRDFIMQIQAGLPVYLKLGCAPLLGDEVQVLTKLMGLVGVKVAMATLLPGIGTLGALAF